MKWNIGDVVTFSAVVMMSSRDTMLVQGECDGTATLISPLMLTTMTRTCNLASRASEQLFRTSLWMEFESGPFCASKSACGT